MEQENTLKTEDIAQYLPYQARVLVEGKKMGTIGGLMVTPENVPLAFVIEDETGANTTCLMRSIQLVLFPLDLTREVTFGNDTFVPADRLDIMEFGELRPNTSMFREPEECIIVEGQSYRIIKQLQKWRFDVGGYIKSGKAISVEEAENLIGNKNKAF